MPLPFAAAFRGPFIGEAGIRSPCRLTAGPPAVQKIASTTFRKDLIVEAQNSIAQRIAPSGLMRTREAAEYLQLAPATLVTWRSNNRKRLAFVKIGGQVRYRRVDLDQFIVDGLRNAA